MVQLRALRPRRTTRRTTAVLGTLTLATLLVGISGAGARPAAPAAPAVSDQRQRDFAAAAREFGVPEDVLLAVSYTLTGWSARSTADGGYGPMRLTDVDAAVATTDGRGDGRTVAPAALAATPALHTLRTAAAVLGVPPERLHADPSQNIRAGAALLAQYARAASGGVLPATVVGWYGAIAGYGTGGDAMAGRAFADDVLATMRAGVPPGVVDGQGLRLAARPGLTLPNAPRAADQFTATDAAECPVALSCRFVAAPYAWTDRSDPGAYGNYDPARRPRDGNAVRYIVIHDTERSYDAAITALQQPTAYTSAHYVIRAADGQVTQMVRTADIAWHAGNWTVNAESVGIEVEGYAAAGGYPEAAYGAAARLVGWLAHRYRVPLDRQHIVGQDEVPGATPTGQSRQQWDPGPYWDWAGFMQRLGVPIRPQAWQADRVVTIAPPFADNRPPLSGSPRRGSNVVLLRTEPRDDAPLLSDPALHPGGGPGTTRADDWGDKAVTGQSFAVAGRRSDWVAVWYGGRKAWFADPGGRLTVPGAGVLVTPVGDGIPVYGRVAPEPAAYPATIPPAGLVRLPYTIPAGQAYPLVDPVAGQDYYARFDGSGVPDNHTLVVGGSRYVRIMFNHRQAFVAAEDVQPAVPGDQGSP